MTGAGRRPRRAFADRHDAGRALARRLQDRAGAAPVVVGLPAGGVPVALEVALLLDAPLDVVVVRKLGLPSHRELAMGAVAEEGVVVLDRQVQRLSGVTDDVLRRLAERELREVARREALVRAEVAPVPLEGRVVLVVDDGLATGTTARAACRVVRGHGARHVVLAVPVAPRGWRARLHGDADEAVCLLEPRCFESVSQAYADFSQVDEAAVLDCLRRSLRRA